MCDIRKWVIFQYENNVMIHALPSMIKLSFRNADTGIQLSHIHLYLPYLDHCVLCIMLNDGY